jgi:hypothetical protein
VPPAAQGASYAALGDSYAAGAAGSDPSTLLPGLCARSSTSWVLGVFAGAQAAGAADELRFVACPGAVVASVRATQLDAVRADTRLVTLSVGGNDAGFGPVTADCLAQPGCGRPGRAAWTAADEGLDGLRVRLTALYRDIRGRMSSRGRLVVTGYPRLFSASLGASEVCAVGDGAVLGADAAWMNGRTAEANAVIAEAARAAGARVVYAATDPEFAGHRLCDPDPWISGLHPDLDGQGAYARAVCGTRVLGLRPERCEATP